MSLSEEQPPIIVRRIKKSHKHHGGAWKVAFADFAVAMMAFFLVLWLSESASDEQKQAISGYFENPVGFADGGSPSVINLGGAVTVEISLDGDKLPDNQPTIQMSEKNVEDLAEQLEQRKLEALKKELDDQIEMNSKLRAFKDQLIIDITDEGLRIQIVDKSQRPMFDSGRSELKFYSETILFELAATIARVPNKLSISGHTDASLYLGRDNYSNWELSADRANAARRALLDGGLPEERIAQVVGHASSVLFDDEDPYHPINRRISILILNRKAQADIASKAGPSLSQGEEVLQQLDSGQDVPAVTPAVKDAEDDFFGSQLKDTPPPVQELPQPTTPASQPGDLLIELTPRC
jgi:chemotaxis protein MotB